jgi:integrase
MDEYLKVRSRVSINTHNTSRAVTARFKCFLKTRGICSIRDISIKALDDYIDHLDTATKTKHNHIKEIKIMLNRAVAENLLDSNPTEHVTLPKIVKKNLHRHLEPVDLQIIFGSAGSWRLYYDFLFRTGMRAGDVAMLSYGNIDRKRSAIISLIRKSRRIHEVPLSNVLFNAIGYGEKDEPLFPALFADTERKLNDNLAKPRHYMQALLQAKGRPKATLHSFRTTFNNTLRDLGLEMDDRRALLAHSSSETTKIYTHPNFDLAKKWVDRLPEFS